MKYKNSKLSKKSNKVIKPHPELQLICKEENFPYKFVPRVIVISSENASSFKKFRVNPSQFTSDIFKGNWWVEGQPLPGDLRLVGLVSARELFWVIGRQEDKIFAAVINL